jgi:hypothetical protein
VVVKKAFDPWFGEHGYVDDNTRIRRDGSGNIFVPRERSREFEAYRDQELLPWEQVHYFSDTIFQNCADFFIDFSWKLTHCKQNTCNISHYGKTKFITVRFLQASKRLSLQLLKRKNQPSCIAQGSKNCLIADIRKFPHHMHLLYKNEIIKVKDHRFFKGLWGKNSKTCIPTQFSITSWSQKVILKIIFVSVKC